MASAMDENDIARIRALPLEAVLRSLGADRAGRAHWYLTAARMIPEAIVEREMQSGRVFADARGNVVFRLRDETGQEVGYEVRGTYEKPYHSVHGEKGLFITKGDDHRSGALVA